MQTETTKRAPKGRTNAITGILVSAVDRSLVEKKLHALKVEFDESESDDELATRLWSYYVDALDEKDQIKCDDCGAIGDKEDDNCPFCGSDDGTLVVAEDEDAEDAAPQSSPPVVLAGGTKQPQKEKEPRAMSTEMQHTNGTHKKNDTRKSSEIPTERDLDSAVKRVIKAKSDSAGSMWGLGQAIADIYDKGLWKLRVDVDSEKQRWKAWEAFCTNELGMTPKNANKLVDISKHFSEDQVRAFGTTKCGLLLEAPEEERPEIEQKVAKGAKVREVKEAVKRANKGRQATEKDSPMLARILKGNETKAKKRAASGSITVAAILGSQTLKMYKKPTTLKGMGPEDLKDLSPASTVGHEPVTCLELANGVTQWFMLKKNAAGDLVLFVKTQRVESV